MGRSIATSTHAGGVLREGRFRHQADHQRVAGEESLHLAAELRWIGLGRHASKQGPSGPRLWFIRAAAGIIRPASVNAEACGSLDGCRHQFSSIAPVRPLQTCISHPDLAGSARMHARERTPRSHALYLLPRLTSSALTGDTAGRIAGRTGWPGHLVLVGAVDRAGGRRLVDLVTVKLPYFAAWLTSRTAACHPRYSRAESIRRITLLAPTP